MRTLTLSTLALIIASSFAAPASAADEDGVTLHVIAEPKLLASHEAFEWTVTVAWEDVAALNATGTPNALDLLAYASASMASTYAVSWFDTDGNGLADEAFVDEVNGVATDFTLILVGYFWALYENGVSSNDAINDIVLAPGDSIELDYTGFPADV